MPRMRRWATFSVLLVGCGRSGFNATSEIGDAPLGKLPGNFPDAAYRDAAGTIGVDSPLAPDGGVASCADFDLGSSMGPVANGDTRGATDKSSTCYGNGSPDLRYAWTAPATGAFTIDTCSGPDQHLDTSLVVLDGSCAGPQLACNDDACGTWLSRVHVDLTAGQLVIIVVDGNRDMGKFALSITQN